MPIKVWKVWKNAHFWTLKNDHLEENSSPDQISWAFWDLFAQTWLRYVWTIWLWHGTLAKVISITRRLRESWRKNQECIAPAWGTNIDTSRLVHVRRNHPIFWHLWIGNCLNMGFMHKKNRELAISLLHKQENGRKLTEFFSYLERVARVMFRKCITESLISVEN